MVGPFRRILPLVVWGGSLGFCPNPSLAQESGTAKAKPANPLGGRLAPSAYALPGEDPPKAFVPAQPRSVADRKRIESLRFYTAARAQEDLRQYPEAVRSLEKALAADPEATPVLRRLSRINFALGREAEAIAYCQRVIAADPGDLETVALLIDHYKDDVPAAETFLKSTLNNPKLNKASTGALYLEFELGNIYEGTLRFDQAAAAFLKIVDALDDRTNARLSPSELRRFLGTDEGQAYLRFGRVFQQVKKYNDAIRAFRRGLDYDNDEPQLLLYLSQVYQEAGRNEEALATIEKFIRRQPRGRDTYDLLTKILVLLKRENEIIPRLEKYAEIDSANVPLQYALAERYKETGQVERAKVIYNRLLNEQKETQGFGDAFPRLVKERKTEELISLLVKVTGRFKRLDTVRAQIADLAADTKYTDEVLDTGLKMISANPPPFEPQDGWIVLVNLATEAKRPEKLVDLLRWSLNRMPNPIVYRELIFSLYELNRFNDAEQVIREMFDKLRDERTTRNLIMLAKIQAQENKLNDAITTVQEALQQDPNDADAVMTLARMLNQAGKPAEAIDKLRGSLQLDPNNPDLVILLGSLLAQLGKSDEAIPLFRDLIEKNANDDAILRAARSTLSTIYTNIGDYAKGEAELELLFVRLPDDPLVNNDLGYLYAEQGKNLEKAEGMIRKALTEEPANGAYLDSLGWVLFKRGKVEEARLPLEKATSDPKNEDTTVFDHLGDVYFQLQEHTKAKTAWERALQLGTQARPPDKRLAEVRKKLDSLRQVGSSPRPSKTTTP